MVNDGALRRQGSHSHRRGVVDAVPPSDLPVFALASKISAGDMDRGDTGGKTVTSQAELRQMRTRFERRAAERDALLARRLGQARADFDGIVDHVWETYRPTRIWQWGSLIDGAHFSERSDIDIALEGISSPAEYFSIIADAEARTRLPVHVVELEKLHPAFADSIRVRGRVVRGD